MNSNAFPCIAGVDYGSKLAGTTVFGLANNGIIQLFQVAKRKDADAFIEALIENHRPSLLFIDAPLSLPGVYYAPQEYNDYFYREADRTLKAMSPMFLGGLTARAMRLKAKVSQHFCPVLEVYPGYLAKELGLTESGYKKQKEQIPDVLSVVAKTLPYPIIDQPQITNWHQIDALLALVSGFRYCRQTHASFGREAEGIIII